MPDAFKSRVMVAVRSSGPEEADSPRDSLTFEPSAPAFTALEAFARAIERRRIARVEKRATKLMAAGKYERVIGLLQDRSRGKSSLLSLLRDAKREAEKDLNSQLENLDVKTRGTGSRGKRRGSNRKVQQQRRSLRVVGGRLPPVPFSRVRDAAIDANNRRPVENLPTVPRLRT